LTAFSRELASDSGGLVDEVFALTGVTLVNRFLRFKRFGYFNGIRLGVAATNY
jgi:hypothetical protein